MLASDLASRQRALPSLEQCAAVTGDPAASLAFSIGLQGFIYGYPIVDLLRQKHAETTRVGKNQTVLAPVNTITSYPGLLTPETQGELKAPNADTLYLNGWFDLSHGPVLLDVPAFGARYYTLAFMDLYGRPQHLGTRTNGGQARRYALIGPAGGEVPGGYEPLTLATNVIWMLGRVEASDHRDVTTARSLSQAISVSARYCPAIADGHVLKPFDGLSFFAMLNQALRELPPVAGEEGLMAMFDTAGFGPGRVFDADALPEPTLLGLGCALRQGPEVLRTQAYKPTSIRNGWVGSEDMSDPGRNYLLRAEVARGGYVNDPRESIYPAAIADSDGRPLSGKNRYRIRFPAGQLPPVDAFWSITAYDRDTLQLTPNPIARYSFSHRAGQPCLARDGSLMIILANEEPQEGPANWLPIPEGNVLLVARLYLPHDAAIDGRYTLPPVERLEGETECPTN